MRDVAVIGVGMHPWGKFPDSSITAMCRQAVEAALEDAGATWPEVQAVSAGSSRFSGGKGWGLNGNDVVEDMGPTGVPVYNLSAGCAAGGKTQYFRSSTRYCPGERDGQGDRASDGSQSVR